MTKHGSGPSAGVDVDLALAMGTGGDIHHHAALATAGATITREPPEMTTYFDTDDLALRRHGVSLRVRTVDGRHVQVLEARGKQTEVAPNRWEWDILTDAPDWALVRQTVTGVQLDAALAERTLSYPESDIKVSAIGGLRQIMRTALSTHRGEALMTEG